MSTYIVTFDLNKQGQNYAAIIKKIESYEGWAKIATTTFIVVSNSSALQIHDKLKAVIDQNDELFVGKIANEAAWTGLPSEVTTWLQANL